MTTREVFLHRVRQALARHPAAGHADAPPAPDERLARLTSAHEDLPRLFRARAAAGGARLLEGAPWPATLANLLAERSIRRIALSIADPALRAAAEACLHQAGVETLQEPGRDHQFLADAGLTDIAAAIAETGTIVLASGPHAPRLTAFIPPVHIALVPRARILPDLLDLFTPGTLPAPMPAALTLISGPSKTADIEGILITGVHGPAELVLVLLP